MVRTTVVRHRVGSEEPLTRREETFVWARRRVSPRVRASASSGETHPEGRARAVRAARAGRGRLLRDGRGTEGFRCTHHTLPSRICVSVDAALDDTTAGAAAGARRRETALRSIFRGDAIRATRGVRSGRAERARTAKHPDEVKPALHQERTEVKGPISVEEIFSRFDAPSALATKRKPPSLIVYNAALRICFSTTGTSPGHAALYSRGRKIAASFPSSEPRSPAATSPAARLAVAAALEVFSKWRIVLSKIGRAHV